MKTPVIGQIKEAPRQPNGQLLPGARLNPNGRPRGSYGGFRRTMEMLFEVANENQERIRQALQEEATTNPARFARRFILPAMPHKYRAAFRERIRATEQT